MQLRFLGTETQGGGSPTLYATDRGTYVVQGWKVDGDEQSLEIPHRLLRHVETGSYLGSKMVDSGRGSFFMTGQAITDQDVLAQMDIPGHETCVEVPSKEEVWFGGVITG